MSTQLIHARPLAALPLLFFLACADCSQSSMEVSSAPPPSSVRDVPMAVSDLVGLSGLGRDDRGSLWVVPESKFVLVELSEAGAELHRYPVSGAPEGVQGESVAWLGPDHFAIGTEGGCAQGSERVLLVTREGDAARVTRVLEVPLASWGASCDDKRGIEGLCAAAGQIVAAIEHPLEDPGGQRLAPIARIAEGSGEVTPYRLALTSKKGKISSLDCRARDGRIEVLAIERDFTVSRLLLFSLPESGSTSPEPIQPKIFVDLTTCANEGKRNFEGVVWLDERRAALLVDNHYGKVTGPNELVVVEVGRP